MYHLLSVLGPTYITSFHRDSTLWVYGEKDSHIHAWDKETEIQRS